MNLWNSLDSGIRAWILTALCFSPLVALFIWSIIKRRKRAKQIQAFVERNGFQYIPRYPPSSWNWLKHGFGSSEQAKEPISTILKLNLGVLKRAGEFKNICHKSSPDLLYSIFDFCYWVSTGKVAAPIQQTIIHFRCPTLNLPSFEVQTQSWLSKIFSKFKPGITIPHAPEFSRKFILRGQNESAIRHTFSPRVLKTIEALGKLKIIGYQQDLIFYRPSYPIPVDDFSKQTSFAESVLEALRSSQKDECSNVS